MQNILEHTFFTLEQLHGQKLNDRTDMCCSKDRWDKLEDKYTDEEKASLTFAKDSDRSICTDCIWLISFLAFWLATVVIYQTAVAEGGNPDR
jgi:hypothetical protein